MYDNELRGLDAWITGGRYNSNTLRVTCRNCGASSEVIAETEYGATYWTPEECPDCHEYYDEKTEWEEYNPADEYCD